MKAIEAIRTYFTASDTIARTVAESFVNETTGNTFRLKVNWVPKKARISISET